MVDSETFNNLAISGTLMMMLGSSIGGVIFMLIVRFLFVACTNELAMFNETFKPSSGERSVRQSCYKRPGLLML
jgi:hypothetical protein